MFPKYDLVVGAGPERVVENEQIVDFVSFKEDWVRNFLRVPQKDLALLTVKGDSMSPSLSDGDMILVDVRASKIEDSAIYVLEFEDALLVKMRVSLDILKSTHPCLEVKRNNLI